MNISFKGSVTCHGNIVKNANCPKDQYMVVKTASYRGKTCCLSDDYSCEVNVTCLVKKQCDGQHECRITVDNNLFSGDLCPGLAKYLYFEYQCTDSATSFNQLCGKTLHLFLYLYFEYQLSIPMEVYFPHLFKKTQRFFTGVVNLKYIVFYFCFHTLNISQLLRIKKSLKLEKTAPKTQSFSHYRFLQETFRKFLL